MSTPRKRKSPTVTSTTYAECRTIGHAWHRTDRPEWQPFAGFPIVFECGRCKMLRLEAWSRATGDLIYRRYARPVGYSQPKGEKLTRKTWRVIYLDKEGL